MFSTPGQIEATGPLPLFGRAADEAAWYAVHIKARHEKRVAALLEEKQVCAFLPLLREIRRWSDRHSKVDVPLFSCYAFVQIQPSPSERLKVLRTPGVFGFVGSESGGTPIPNEQIEGVKAIVGQDLPFFPYPYLKAGRRVRIRSGSLEGIEGILVRQDADQTLVLNVDLLQRSICIRVEGYDIEPA